MLYLGIDQHRKQLTVCIRNESGDVIFRRQVSTAVGAGAGLPGGDPQEGRQGRICGDRGGLRFQRLAGEAFGRIRLPRSGFDPAREAVQEEDRPSGRQRLVRAALGEPPAAVGGQAGAGSPPYPAADGEGGRRPPAHRTAQAAGPAPHAFDQRGQAPVAQAQSGAGVPDQGDRHDHGRSKWLAKLALGRMDRLEMDLLLAQWKLWDEQIQTLEAEITRRQAENKTAAVIATVPGCGAYSSLALASRIGSIERFPRPSSLANYWGLTPGCRNSGEATDRLGSITKQGSATARFILGQLVLHVLRRDAWMRAWYARIKKRRGSKIARVAVMRRLATILWHMVKHNEPYMAGGPPRQKLRKKAA